jgi:hypothetical protein
MTTGLQPDHAYDKIHYDQQDQYAIHNEINPYIGFIGFV